MPSVLRKQVSDWFELNCDSPNVVFVAGVSQAERLAVDQRHEGHFGIDRLGDWERGADVEPD